MDDGSWSIPLEALDVLSGPTEQVNGSGGSGHDPGQVDPSDPLFDPSPDLSELRAALADAERRAAVAEALAQERAERLSVMDAQLSQVLTQAQEHAARLTALEAARQVARLRSAPVPDEVQETPQKRRWWSRGRSMKPREP